MTGSQLRERRLAKGQSRAELAGLYGISEAEITSIEAGDLVVPAVLAAVYGPQKFPRGPRGNSAGPHKVS